MEYIWPKHLQLTKKDLKEWERIKKVFKIFLKGIITGICIFITYIIIINW